MPIAVRGGKFQTIEVSLDSNSSTSNNSNNSETKTNGQKKKRPRQRLRVRNKNYKLLTGAITPPLVNGVVDKKPADETVGNSVAKNLYPPVQQPVELNVRIEKETPQAHENSRETKQTVSGNSGGPMEKTREQIIAEREAKKLAKQAKKGKQVPSQPPATTTTTTSAPVATNQKIIEPTVIVEKAPPPSRPTTNEKEYRTMGRPSAEEMTREQIQAGREAKKNAKNAAKAAKSCADAVQAINEQIAKTVISNNETTGKPTETQGGEDKVAQTQGDAEKKKPTLTKAERRAIQEAQRAAKAQGQAQKALKPQQQPQQPSKPTTKPAVASAVKKSTSGTADKLSVRNTVSPTKSSTSPSKSVKWSDCCVLFKHLESPHRDVSQFVNDPNIHPSIARLGVQYANRTVVGSNARCIAFLSALKMVIQDFETPPKKEFGRSLETCITHSVDHLEKCRALAVSVSNAYKHIKHVLTQLPMDKPESELKENLCHFIDTYVENQIGKAAQAISSSMQEKITDGDVILTFGCSSLIDYICEEAQRRRVDFSVIVVDSRPFCEGQEQLRRLTAKEIPCTYVLINAVSFVMPQATKVLLGAHALLSNGYVMARTGTAQVALVARSYNVPVLVCCETHKFSERYQTDAIVFNELGNPDDLIRNEKCCLSNWQAKCKMTPLNLMYDITPPELVTAVVTEVSILPCTSVPVILRIKPTEIGYYS